MSKFIKLKQLVLNIPKQEIMGTKKEIEFKIGTFIIDVDDICACMYQIRDFENISNDEKELNKYCEENNLTLVKLVTNRGLHFVNVINPHENYFEDLLNVQNSEK